MRFKRSFRFVGINCLLMATSFAINTPRAGSQSGPDAVPSIADLKSLSYHKANPPNLTGPPSFSDVMTITRLARAYLQGKQMLPKYSEPILTRGSSGIAVFKTVAPSVVLVVIGDVKNEKFEPSGLGAGVILNSSGDILTNWHVINGYSGALIFLKPTGRADIDDSDAYGARLVTQDETTDLALLHMIKPPSTLRSIGIGNITSVQVAEDIHVIGHPKGNLWSYTTGVVNQVRDRYEWTYDDGSKHEAKVLQLQTAINPGNSGGPVVDDQDKLIGLVAMGEEGQNLNYAIAADVIQAFLSRASLVKTRGGTPELKSSAAEFSVARLRNEHAVERVNYPDLTEYFISDQDGNALTFRAEINDGVELEAWKPNSFGGFAEWRISFRDGTSVRARGTGNFPDTFSVN